MTGNPPTAELALLPALRRWWWALLLAGAVAGAVGHAVASRASKTYEATVKALVGPVNTDISLGASGTLGRTYAELATSRPVLAAAIAATHAPRTVVSLTKSVTANSNDVTRLVTITVSDGSPTVAAALANALAARLTALALQSPPEFNSSIQTFDSQPEITSLTAAQARGVDQAARRTFGIARAGLLQTVDPATPPLSAASPKIPLITLLAALGGVIMAGLLALLKESLGRRVLDELALREIGGPPFVGAVDAAGYADPARALFVEERPGSAAAAGYRLLGARLRLLDDDRRIKSIVVLDVAGGTAAAGVAANLAAAAAAANRSVLLVDATGRDPSVTAMLALGGEAGYAEAISQPAVLSRDRLDELCVSRPHGLRFLPRGKSPGPEVVPRDGIRRVLRTLSVASDLVVICGPSLGESAAAMTWAQAADAALLVVESGRASREEVVAGCADLARVDAEVLGLVLARPVRRLRLPRRASAPTA